jgi:hypothetical protein
MEVTLTRATVTDQGGVGTWVALINNTLVWDQAENNQGPVGKIDFQVDVFITEGGLWGDDFDADLVMETQWGTGTFIACTCALIRMQLKPNADYQARGYTNLMYDLVRLTTSALPCPIDNLN